MECKKIYGMNYIKNKTSPYMTMFEVIRSSASEDSSGMLRLSETWVFNSNVTCRKT